MIIALLVVLGVDLIVVVAVLAVVLARKRWASHQPGWFKGAIRVVDGEVPGLGAKWKRGYGRWVRDILVCTKAPSLFRKELVAVDALATGARTAEPGEVKRLGKQPIVVALTLDGGRASRLRPQWTGVIGYSGHSARRRRRPPVSGPPQVAQSAAARDTAEEPDRPGRRLIHAG